MVKGDFSESLLILVLSYQNTPSCLKVRGGKWECAGSHVELPLLLDLALHLVILLGRWVKVIILKHFYYWHFFTRALLHA